MKNKSTQNEIFDELMNSDAYKEWKKLIEERRKTVIKGDNVVHLQYLGELSSSELIEIDEKLQTVGLKLSSFDESNIIFANNLEEYSLVTFFVLSQPVIIELLNGVGTNALWDAIKYSVLYVRNKVKGEKWHKYIAGGKTEERETKFGIKVHLDKNTSFNFELSGDVADKTIELALDKTFDFLREQKIRESYQNSDYVYYDEKKAKWIKLNSIEKKKGKKNKK